MKRRVEPDRKKDDWTGLNSERGGSECLRNVI